MIQTFKQAVAGIVLALLLATTPVGATLLELYTLKRLTVESHAIVLAQAIHQETNLKSQKVYTFTTFRVEDVLLGDLTVGQTFVLRQRGGRVGKYVVATLGDAKFRVGERYVLFLRHSGKEWTLTAMAQAAFHAFKLNGKWWVENRSSPPRLNRSNGKVLYTPILSRQPLDDFLVQIRTTIETLAPAKRSR